MKNIRSTNTDSPILSFYPLTISGYVQYAPDQSFNFFANEGFNINENRALSNQNYSLIGQWIEQKTETYVVAGGSLYSFEDSTRAYQSEYRVKHISLKDAASLNSSYFNDYMKKWDKYNELSNDWFFDHQ